MLPESLEKIDMLAFHDCANLKEITIPKNVTEIGDRAFGQYGNSGLDVMDGFIVYGYTDSAAKKYVNDVNSIKDANGKIKFVALNTESNNNNTNDDNNSSSDNNSASSDDNNSSSDNNSTSSNLAKSSPKTGDNIPKMIAPLLMFTSVMVLSKKHNRKK